MAGERDEGPVVDSGEKRLNELGYKQELRREMTLFKTLAISFSTMTLFTGITPLYGSSLQYAGPASLVWGWVVVSFFTWFVGIAMAEICSSFPTTGSLYFWAAHLAGPVWGPLASWCCAWLEAIGLIAGIGTQAYAGSQVLQSIILLCTGTNKGGGYLTPRWLFLVMYIGLTLIWAVLNTFALEVIAFLDVISMWWQVIGGTVIVVMLPLVAKTTQPASYVFTHFEKAPGGDRDQQQRLRRRAVLPGEPVLPVRVRRGGAPDGGDQGRRQERPHRHPLQHRHHLRVRLGLHPGAHLQHPGFQLLVRPEQRDRRDVRAGADPVRRVPRAVPQLVGRHRAAVRHLGLLLLRRALHHDERGAGGVRAVAGPRHPLLVGVAPHPPAAQGAGERGVAVRRAVRAAGPSDPAHQRRVHGHHLRRHHRLGGRLRGAHLRAHGDAGGQVPAGPVLPRPRQQARLPRCVPVDLLHLLRLLAAHQCTRSRWTPSTTRPSRSASASASSCSGGCSTPASGSRVLSGTSTSTTTARSDCEHLRAPSLKIKPPTPPCLPLSLCL
ncbi:hypothetical protein BS78_06G100700 [Paspalum vaginatum]|nr:hypothetical protein BS78_06G100700 [Paspalum vaginatum]